MLFGRKKIFRSEAQKAAEALSRTKKVQYTPMKLSEAEELVAADINALVSFEPVNYYAEKVSFLQCTFYYSEDYSEVYFHLERFDNDRATASGEFRKADYELMRSALRRFGQQI